MAKPGRVLISTIGSHGDVVPYLGLGVGLRQAGHRVVIATQEPFEPVVLQAGLEFRQLPGDMKADLGKMAEQVRPGPGLVLDGIRRSRDGVRELGEALHRHVLDGDVLALTTMTVSVGTIIAEARKLASFGAFLQPLEPTREFAPVLSGRASFGAWGNRAIASALPAMFARLLAKGHADFASSLGVPYRGYRAAHRRERETAWPVLHGISPHVLPRPADWRPGLEMVGYWWPPTPTGWQPPAELGAFLAAGPPPVQIGFGSMGGGHGERLTPIVAEALRTSGVRAVVQRGWADLGLEPGPDLLLIDDVPHEWLLPRCAASVHHAGAGTTAATLRAGIPSIPVPSAADQPFWAHRLIALGAAPTALPFRKLTATALAAAIDTVVRDTRYRDAAASIATRLAAEDGTAPVLRVIDQVHAAA